MNLRKIETIELQRLKRESEISLQHIYSRSGRKQSERYLEKIEAELERRKRRELAMG